MELTFIIIVGIVFMVLGGICVGSVILGLPGAWMLLAMAVIIEFVDSIYLSEGNEQTFDWWLLGACLALAVIGEVFELVAGALGAKKAGSSRRGMIGAVLGGIVGAILAFGFLPPIGPLIGAVIGTFVGAIVGELTGKDDPTVREALKPAAGATIGKILGTLSKVPIAVAIWVALCIAAFWR